MPSSTDVMNGFTLVAKKVSNQMYEALENDTDELWYCKDCKIIVKVKAYS